MKAFQGAVQHGHRLGRGKDRTGGVEEGSGSKETGCLEDEAVAGAWGACRALKGGH